MASLHQVSVSGKQHSNEVLMTEKEQWPWHKSFALFY